MRIVRVGSVPPKPGCRKKRANHHRWQCSAHPLRHRVVGAAPPHRSQPRCRRRTLRPAPNQCERTLSTDVAGDGPNLSTDVAGHGPNLSTDVAGDGRDLSTDVAGDGRDLSTDVAGDGRVTCRRCSALAISSNSGPMNGLREWNDGIDTSVRSSPRRTPPPHAGSFKIRIIRRGAALLRRSRRKRRHGHAPRP